MCRSLAVVATIRWASAGALLVACAHGPAAAQSSGCLPEQPDVTAVRLDYLRAIVSGTDSLAAIQRDAFALDPVADPSEVVLVTKESTCAAAAAALSAEVGQPGTSRLVWVYQLGGGDYAVEDPNMPQEEGDSPLFVFDRYWKAKATIVVF